MFREKYSGYHCPRRVVNLPTHRSWLKYCWGITANLKSGPILAMTIGVVVRVRVAAKTPEC